MSCIRTGVLAGVATASLVGSARADDQSRNHVRAFVERQTAKDGRGDTSGDFRAARVAPERPQVERTSRPTPEVRHEAPVRLKTEIEVRLGEDKDSVNLPGAAATPAAADAKAALLPKKEAPLPIKTEVMLRMPNAEGDGAATETTATAKTAASPKTAAPGSLKTKLSTLPIKTEYRLRMSEGGGDESDSK